MSYFKRFYFSFNKFLLNYTSLQYMYINNQTFLITETLRLTFFKLGKLGKPFSDVNPTFIKLRDSSVLNSSVKPSTCDARQLSKFNSFICNTKCFHVRIIEHVHMHYFQFKMTLVDKYRKVNVIQFF